MGSESQEKKYWDHLGAESEDEDKDTGGGGKKSEKGRGQHSFGGCAGGWAGRSGVDHLPRASWEGLEHLGQRKGVKSLRNGRDF